jgi:signal transduction histidine kinase
VPIATKDQVLGFINLGSLIPYFFTPIHADRLQAFAEQAAIAIQNARLHEETKELAAHYERQRLARDLHDAMSQTLFAVTITTETLMRQAEQDPASIVPKLAELHQLARGALAETRAVLLELRPESLTDISLESLLEQLRDAVLARKQLRISLELDHTETLDPELKLVLYRIAQEALNNIVKHAQASQVNIRLTQDSAGATFEIRDDGVGFDPDSRSPSSMGLNIMRERAEGVGATLNIRSASSAGTQITVRWENVARKASS